MIKSVVVAMTGASAWAKPKPKPVTVTNFPATQPVQVENFPPSPAFLGPTKPSQVVTLTYSNVCTGTSALSNIIDIE